MLQDATTKTIDAGQSAYMTLTTVQHEVGISRGTLKKYLAYWERKAYEYHNSEHFISPNAVWEPLLPDCGDWGCCWRTGGLHGTASVPASRYGHGICVCAAPDPHA